MSLVATGSRAEWNGDVGCRFLICFGFEFWKFWYGRVYFFDKVKEPPKKILLKNLECLRLSFIHSFSYCCSSKYKNCCNCSNGRGRPSNQLLQLLNWISLNCARRNNILYRQFFQIFSKIIRVRLVPTKKKKNKQNTWTMRSKFAKRIEIVARILLSTHSIGNRCCFWCGC